MYTSYFIYILIFAGTTDGLTIATAEYIYPNTCNNITCYYESAIDERTTTFTVTAANGNRLFEHNIIQIISSNVCVLDSIQHCNAIGVCWCDPNDLSTRICYNHTISAKDQVRLMCATYNTKKERLATVAANPSNIRPNNMIYSVKEGSIFGPLICNASCGPPCTFQWVGPDSVINSSVLLFNTTAREENGTYQCESTNTVGTIIANIVLIVKHGPNKVILSPNETFLLLNEGSDVPNIKCKADCQPGCTFTWISPNGQEESTDILTIKNIQMNQTGTYKCNASNEVSNTVSAGVTIILVCPPEHPTDVLVTCDITSMIVSWRSGSNGGLEQTFIVAWLNINTQHTDYSLKIKDSGQEQIQQYIVKSLYPDTMYLIHVEATNKHGTVRSTKNANCTTRFGSNNRSENYLTKSIGASIGASFFILIVACLTVFVLKIMKRRAFNKKENSKLYQSTQPGTSSSPYDEIGRINDEHSYQDLKKDNKGLR